MWYLAVKLTAPGVESPINLALIKLSVKSLHNGWTDASLVFDIISKPLHLCNGLEIILKTRLWRSSLDLAFGGRTEQRNYIEMGLSTPGAAKVIAKYYISI